jgi:hypothetical protein
MGSQGWFKRYRRTHEKMPSDGRPVLERLGPGPTEHRPGRASSSAGVPEPVGEIHLLLPAQAPPRALPDRLCRRNVPDSRCWCVPVLSDDFEPGVSRRESQWRRADHGVWPTTVILGRFISFLWRSSSLLPNTLLEPARFRTADQLRDWAALPQRRSLYGCDVADGAAGVGFLDRLSTLTGSIAASTTPGSPALGATGIWSSVAVVEAMPPFHLPAG